MRVGPKLGAPYRHLGIPVLVGSYTFGRVQSGIGVGRGGAATHLCVEITSFRVDSDRKLVTLGVRIAVAVGSTPVVRVP